MSEPWTPGDATGVRRHAPATLRNRQPIRDALAGLLPRQGTVLEVASGSGEHVAYLAPHFPDLVWQPSDTDPAALASIADWTAGQPNVLPPLHLDAEAVDWPVDRVEALWCANMIHIAPWSACEGLFAGAARHVDGAVILYGPFLRDGVKTAASNLAFDASLRARDARWGVRRLEDVDAVAGASGFERCELTEMPANNLMVLWQRVRNR